MALFSAVIIWFFVSHSIIEEKVIRNVPIRISNLPAEKTIVGLLPNGILMKRINLTLTGVKDVIDEIEPGDLEVNIDATAIDHADWIVQINKKNLVSLNPSIDLANNITDVTHSDFVIKLNRLMTAKVAIDILQPQGVSPEGYEFLDIWPQRLMQSISGPEEEIHRLKTKGLELTIDLNRITKAELDALKSQQLGGANNEVSFYVPYNWKQISIPYRNSIEEINDPDAQSLRIDFLRKEFIPIERKLPVQVFYPTKTLETVNPDKIALFPSQFIVNTEGVNLFTLPLHVKNVSRLFMEIVRDYLGITIVANAKAADEILPWSLEVMTPHELEETYVAYQMANGGKQVSNMLNRSREMLYRKRFRNYLHDLTLYLSPGHKLSIESSIKDEKIEILDY